MSDLSILLVVVSIFAACLATGVYGIRLGCRLFAGFIPSIKETVIVIGWVTLANIPISVIYSIAGHVHWLKSNWMAQLSIAIVGIGVAGLVVGVKLKRPEGGSIGAKKGCLVSLIWTCFGMAVTVLVAALIGFGASLYGGRSVTLEADVLGSSLNSAPLQENQQQALLLAAQEAIARFPQLDIESPNKDQAAIDYVIRTRDWYHSKGHDIDAALRLAVNAYAGQLQQRTPVVTSGQSNNGAWVAQRADTHGKAKCVIQPVMTDAEIAACK